MEDINPADMVFRGSSNFMRCSSMLYRSVINHSSGKGYMKKRNKKGKRTKTGQKAHSKQKCILPEPNHKMGYTSMYLDLILICMGIDKSIFWDKFGVNTCAIYEPTGQIIYYKRDLESALSRLGYDISYHGWD